MAKDFTITITQVVSGNYQPVTNLDNLKLKNTGGGTEIAGTHIGDGVYKFPDVPDDVYKLWNDTTEVVKWGGTNGRWIGDETLPYIGDDGGGHWTGQDKRLHNIADPVSGIDVGDRDYNDGRYLKLSGGTMSGNIAMGGNNVTGSGNLVDKSTPQTISAKKSITGGMDFMLGVNGENYPKIFYQDEIAGEVYKPPTNPLHAIPKQYADSLVAGITIPPVPYSSTEVLIITGVTEVVGKIYSSILNAANYLLTAGLGISKRGVIYLRGNTQAAYYVAAPGSLQNYMNWIGYAPAIINSTGDYTSWNNLGTVIVVCEKTATKKMTIADSTLIFGDSTAFITNNQTGARTYSEFCFVNCVIFAYNEVAFNNCTLLNTTVISSGSYKATLQNCKVMGCYFNNEPAADQTNVPFLASFGFSWPISNDITAYIPN